MIPDTYSAQIMTIISKYLAREIVKFISIVLAMVVSIYVAVDFFEKIDSFIGAGLPYWKAFAFFMFKTPFIVAQILPVCVLLSVLIVFGLMSKRNEALALKSSGVSIWYLFGPVFSIGILSGAVLFFISEIVVPISMEKANKIWLREVKEESAVVSREQNIWFRDNRRIIHINYYNRSSGEIAGVTLYNLDENFRIAKRVDAGKGVFKDGKWLLDDIMELTLDETTGNYRVDFHDGKTENLLFTPENLQMVVKESEEMNLIELYEYIRKIENEGYDATEYRVDFHGKIAFPFICVIMSLIGTGIAAPIRKDGLAVAVALGIGVAFVYWSLFSFCMSLGYGEMLPPPIAAWTANFIFLCFGVFLLLHAE